MTLIATDGKSMAADGLRISNGNMITGTDMRKIHKRDGGLYGFSGMVAMRQPIIDWVVAGADPERMPKAIGEDESRFTLLVADKNGLVMYDEACPYPMPLTAPFAMGYGCEQALAAMKLGKPAREAVELACEMTVFAGGEVREEPLPSVTPATRTLEVKAGSAGISNISYTQRRMAEHHAVRTLESDADKNARCAEYNRIVNKAAKGALLTQVEGILLKAGALGYEAEATQLFGPHVNGSGKVHPNQLRVITDGEVGELKRKQTAGVGLSERENAIVTLYGGSLERLVPHVNGSGGQ